MRQIIYLFSILLMFSCSSDEIFDTEVLESDLQSTSPSDIEIVINTTRDSWNMLENPLEANILKSRPANPSRPSRPGRPTDPSRPSRPTDPSRPSRPGRPGSSSDPFTEIRDVESTESVVLPELIPHVWVGNIMKKSSIADCIYQPLIYPRSSINVGLTLPGTTPKTIASPTSLNYLSYVQEQTAKGSFAQSNEFNFTIEQFTSYNELKVAFGSNVNTDMLFWGSSSSSQNEEHRIDKATGLYVKFYQTSFKAFMDYPQGTIANIPSDMVNEAVYINSITYGRLGILTLETNSTAEYSKEVINRTFSKLFVSGSSSLTTEEQRFLNGCDFKVYLIGGNGSTAVQSFTGYAGFIQHIKKGTFSKNEPGTPLFCTFNHVKDNSPVKVNFKFSMKKQPLYVEFQKRSDELYLNFYKSRSKVPVIADPKIKFRFHKYTSFTTDFNGDRLDCRIDEDFYKDVSNAGYQTSLKLLTFMDMPERRSYNTYSPTISIATYSRSQLRLLPNNDIVILGNDYYGDKTIYLRTGQDVLDGPFTNSHDWYN